MPKQSVLQTRLARELRRSSTDAERALWHELRDRDRMGGRFRRQVPIDRYVADFTCPDARLVVEVDGRVHDDPAVRAADEHRTRDLEALGYRVVRFRNEDVLQDPARVAGIVRAILSALPSPAKRERGGG